DPKFFPQLIAPKNIDLGGGVMVTNHQITVVVVSLVLMVGLTLFIARTRTGKAMRAVAFHRDAASLMGIPVNRIITITFAIGSALAAAAGVLVGLTNPKIEPLMGIMPGVKAFVAAVLGGIGSVPGAVIGGVVMGVSEYLVVGYVSSTFRDAIAFVILILVLLIKPAGILGRNVAEKV
ncbi:MAG TPA: branched-chain amino acid ABC transporter permease, partial [Candidatus Eisenbacteria bacterium]|nr:branched-chain amino acid ABC transporter permease [Candidatus Eisenbacteria bacterium]